MGKYNHTIDPKGRLSIPAKYREELGDEFVISNGMEGCLLVYAMNDWMELQKNIVSLPLFSKDARRMTRFVMSGAQSVTVDKQGRILMPQDLREYAGLEKDVILAGMGNRIEIWDLDRWKAEFEQIDVDELSEALINKGHLI